MLRGGGDLETSPQPTRVDAPAVSVLKSGPTMILAPSATACDAAAEPPPVVPAVE